MRTHASAFSCLRVRPLTLPSAGIPEGASLVGLGYSVPRRPDVAAVIFVATQAPEASLNGFTLGSPLCQHA
jgi:hypothetical protein